MRRDFSFKFNKAIRDPLIWNSKNCANSTRYCLLSSQKSDYKLTKHKLFCFCFFCNTKTILLKDSTPLGRLDVKPIGWCSQQPLEQIAAIDNDASAVWNRFRERVLVIYESLWWKDSVRDPTSVAPWGEQAHVLLLFTLAHVTEWLHASRG